jgi:hypothetical protein
VVKPAYILLQQNKCVFCERQLESPEYGRIEFDLEHFRPKSSVAAWPTAAPHAPSFSFPTGAAGTGYYWLAYDPQNYAASCKTCNSPLKANFFPVAGRRGAAGRTIDKLSAEKPFLCYPLGDLDEDPEKLVTFMATTAVPAARAGHRRRRGEVIIEFFQLNRRDMLHRERARLISILGTSLRALADGSGDDMDRTVVTNMQAAGVPHAGCLRAFDRLWRIDQTLGRDVLNACRAYAFSVTGTKPPAPPAPPPLRHRRGGRG